MKRELLPRPAATVRPRACGGGAAIGGLGELPPLPTLPALPRPPRMDTLGDGGALTSLPVAAATRAECSACATATSAMRLW